MCIYIHIYIYIYIYLIHSCDLIWAEFADTYFCGIDFKWKSFVTLLIHYVLACVNLSNKKVLIVSIKLTPSILTVVHVDVSRDWTGQDISNCFVFGYFRELWCRLCRSFASVQDSTSVALTCPPSMFPTLIRCHHNLSVPHYNSDSFLAW